MQSNIWKIYTLQAVRMFLVTMPIIVLFFETEINLSYFQIFLLQSIFAITIVIFEIPSGYFGDVFKRKTSLLIGFLFAFAGNFVFCFSYSFLPFVIGEVLIAIGISFISGSDSALLYDSLVASKTESKYGKLEGRNYAIGNFSEAGAALIGGWLALASLRYPFYVQTAALLIGVAICLLLVEPKRVAILSHRDSLKNFKKIFKYMFNVNPRIIAWILFSGFVGVATLTGAWIAQPLFKSVDLPLAYYGLLWAALNVVVGIASWFGGKVMETNNKTTVSAIILILVITGFVLGGMFSNYFAIACFALLYIGRGFAAPAFRDYINKITPSNMRATVMSSRSLFIRLAFAIFGPIVGLIADEFSVQEALLAAAATYLVLSLISLVYLKKLNAFK